MRLHKNFDIIIPEFKKFVFLLLMKRNIRSCSNIHKTDK